MYDQNYVKSWIENHESGKDNFRKDYLEPYLKDSLEQANADAPMLRKEAFVSIKEENEKHINGIVNLPSGVPVEAEVYFHKEAQLEQEISKYSTFIKTTLGPIFVGYQCYKK